jgi:anti-anti-sigma factor
MTPAADHSLAVTREHGAVVVTVHGEIDLARSVALGAVLGDLIDGQGNLSVVVDLAEVTRVDPAGLGVFAAAAKLARRRGGLLTVTGVPPAHRYGAPPVTGASDDRTHHLVEFYDSDEVLARSVADHIQPGLQGDDGVIVVATQPHRDLFEAALGPSAGLGGARAAGRYLAVDAEEALSRFMVDGAPDPRRFRTTIGDLIAAVAGPTRRVRIYGEMVAVLWAEGNVSAAIALEDLWNDLGRSRPFSLLCAYPVTAFDVAESTGLFRSLCDQHSPVDAGGRPA